ncbi:DUF2301 domain-containing membrane protein [Prochlorococcus sp. MIT 1307]|uniref:DUF2301 domain-containing membrane protein n=1 Tax=Prochlorococcus sp. MIT 1307 TaxID=3096219 RepID=UPI002A75DA30|nr:DUF2301 domain-containing membrane protein [Prochlorococcus sp. MIT 1307]
MPENKSLEEPEFQGLYGNYKITKTDQIEVQRYRISVLLCGIAFCAGIGHWLFIGPSLAWLWLFPIAIGLGLALKWIHIYLRPLHKTLQILWATGCIGIAILLLTLGGANLLTSLAEDPIWTLAIGPLFAALTGLGFKEFFCFRRLEAIGLTLLVPIALIGHLTTLISGEIVMALLSCSAFLLLILAIRKFGMDAAADVGDKSVFAYLDNQHIAKSL